MSENTIIAKGGIETTVKIVNGPEEKLLVKLLPLSKIPDYFANLENDIGLMELCTGKSKTFCENIDFDSGLELLDLIHTVNFQRASRWAERRAERMGQYMPAAKKGYNLQKQLMT